MYPSLNHNASCSVDCESAINVCLRGSARPDLGLTVLPIRFAGTMEEAPRILLLTLGHYLMALPMTRRSITTATLSGSAERLVNTR